jgi:cyclic pyranopterin phosphate synthase
LVREDIVEIVRLLRRERSVKEISMVTNGTLLTGSLASSLKQNGLMRMNINIPSVEKDTYRRLTGGELGDALEGVRAALSAGLDPVKVNMLMLRDLNHDQVDSMLGFCSKIGATLQIIELEPLNIDPEYYSRHHFPLDGIEKKLSSKAKKIEVRRSMHGRRVYDLGNAKIEIVRPVENTAFCLRCSRMRLTSDGRLKSCLMRSDDLVDLLGPIRTNATDRELGELIVASARRRQPFYVLKQAASPSDS